MGGDGHEPMVIALSHTLTFHIFGKHMVCQSESGKHHIGFNFLLLFFRPQTIEIRFSWDSFEKGCFQRLLPFRWARSSFFAYEIMNTQFCAHAFWAPLYSSQEKSAFKWKTCVDCVRGTQLMSSLSCNHFLVNESASWQRRGTSEGEIVFPV